MYSTENFIVRFTKIAFPFLFQVRDTSQAGKLRGRSRQYLDELFWYRIFRSLGEIAEKMR